MTRSLVVTVVLAATLILAGANAHLLYVAFKSQPECVEHLKAPDSDAKQFRAAKPSC